MISEFNPGDWVLAQWQGGHLWFPGVVHSVGEDGSVAIRYDDGTSEIRPANQVKPYDWDVGSRIDAIWSGNGQWYAATITEADPDGRTSPSASTTASSSSTVTGRCRSE